MATSHHPICVCLGGNLLRSGETESPIADRVSRLPRRPSSCAFVPALVLWVPINGAITYTGTHDSGISDTGYLAHPCSGVVWCRAAPLISASRVSLSALLLNSSIALLLLPFISSSAPLLLHSLPGSPSGICSPSSSFTVAC